jgi:hypothetical protein
MSGYYALIEAEENWAKEMRMLSIPPKSLVRLTGSITSAIQRHLGKHVERKNSSVKPDAPANRRATDAKTKRSGPL